MSDPGSNVKSLKKVALIRRNHDSAGGAELYTDRLMQGLAAEGIETHLFSESWPDPSAILHPLSVHASRSVRPKAFAEAAAEAINKAGPFDAVLSLERTACQDVLRAGDGVHRAWLERRNAYRPFWRRMWTSNFHRTILSLEKKSFRPDVTRHIIVNSELVKNEILRYFDFPASHIHLVRNGIALSRFEFSQDKRTAARKRLGLEPDEYVLAFAGSGWERKGLRFALAAFEKINDPKMRFIVAGRGKMRMPRRVLDLGAVSQIEQIYFAADLFVFPTIYDPSANVCFEAMAAGLPVITTCANGASEVISEGITGHRISAPHQQEELIAAILYWRDRRFRIAHKALPDFSIERNIAETLEVLRQP